MAILGTVAGLGLVPKVLQKHYAMALDDLIGGEMLRKNLELFNVFAERSR